MLTVVSFFWVDPKRHRSYRITPEDVRIWDRMVARNLTVPHKRICATHRPDLIHFMDTVPMDTEKHIPGLCTAKLQAHKPGGVAKEGDRVLLMDVDCVVTGILDPLVQDNPDAVTFLDECKWWKNPNHDPSTEDGRRRGFIQGSMQLFTVGATEFLWRDLNETTVSMINRRFGGGEQAWISERMNNAWPEPGWRWDVPHWTEEDGVYGAGRLFNGKMGKGVHSELPSNARIVFTPGDRGPSQLEMRTLHPWIERFYH